MATTPTPELVWTGRDNTIDLLLKADGVARTDLDTSVTKMVLRYNDVYYSSTEHSGVFDWVTRGSEGIVILSLGHLGLTGSDRKAELIVYDASNTNGIVWDQIYIKVTDEALPTTTTT
jgi:hypothetical protein